MTSPKPLGISMVIAILLTLIALLIRLVMAPVEAGLQYLTFFPAVTLAAILGGYRAGLASAVLGAFLATSMFTAPYGWFTASGFSASAWSNLVFLTEAVIICAAIETLQRTLSRQNMFLRASQEAERLLLRHKAVLESTLDGFWVTDLQGNLLEVNQSYASMMGYEVSELLGKHIRQFEADETNADIEQHIRHIVAKGGDRFETRHRHKLGHLVDIEVSVNYIEEHQHLFAFFRDISARKRADEELRIAAVTFETDAAIMINDADGNILRVNQAFEKITGYVAAEVIGQNPRILSSGRHEKSFYDGMWSDLLTKGSWSGEVWDRRKNGEVYPKWLTITQLRNPDQNVTGYVAFFSDISERKQAEEEIRNLAFYDPLTRLPNRRLLLDRFHQSLHSSERSQQYGAILFLDMDKFKVLNDTMGHDFGDLMLIEVAERIGELVRDVDTVARIGGDEFVVLLENMGDLADDASNRVALVAEKIRASLSEEYRIKDHIYHSSPSIGVCLFKGNAVTVNDILKHADIALYQAKNNGRNTVRFYDPVLQQSVANRARLEADLRVALSRRQMEMHYQIQVDRDGRPLGAEALIRWRHPERGMISPGEFIPLAEESALILGLGKWIIERACQQLASWASHERTQGLILAINVSAHQFRLPDFVESVIDAAHRHGIRPNLLKLELTESVVLADIEDVIAKMQALKAHGFRLSLDDFGTGYSSLAYLKRLPLTQIKIDQSFVRDVASDANDAMLIKAIIDMAKNFKLNVIAEGVETEVQFAILKQLGCPAFQGYLFGKPVPVDALEATLGQLVELN